MERKNYSFYMPSDFGEKFKQIQEEDDKLKVLSRSQAVYLIVSELAQTGKYVKNQPQENS